MSNGQLTENGKFIYPGASKVEGSDVSGSASVAKTTGEAGKKEAQHDPKPGESKPAFAENDDAESTTEGSPTEEQNIASKFYGKKSVQRAAVIAKANS